MHHREIVDDYELEMEEYADEIESRLTADLAAIEDWDAEFEDDPHEVPCGDLRPLEELDRIVLPIDHDERDLHPRAA